MTLGTPERAACEELACTPRGEFAGIQRFIPPVHEPQLLAFEALFRSIRDIPLTVSDPSVGLAKLGWWQKELVQAATGGSQHPVVRAMIETGALDRLDPDCFNAYLHGLMMQLHDTCLNTTAELEATLRETAGKEAQLLTGSPPPATLMGAACAARLLELLRTLSNTNREHVWLPMDLVARHTVSRNAGGSDSSRAELVRDLAELAVQWREAGGAVVDCAGEKGAGRAYMVLRDSLVGKRLVQAGQAPAGFLTRGDRPRFGEVLTTWNRARRLLRDKCWET